jgi:hypothetical protein
MTGEQQTISFPKRETSRQSWHEFKDSPEQRECFSLVRLVLEESWKPLTGREIEKEAEYEGLHKRLSEMKNLGIIEERPKRRCSITGKTSLTWQLIDKIDMELVK